ncbi:receptor-like cytosolic serine/threonine-protein kinase RBK2 [Phragmites australis]|uniref:receptor-like cytosolic serine/threonine-protein kinase RBK2 n=1 Tax=Phragmites australis TaxID=29695 RepID=UPI002D78EEC9|nr:receptor-like cytosolic serine/threonine-protein kinase RBK2 [Phragmites australis]
MMSDKNTGGVPSRGNSEDADSLRSVLNGYMTTSNATTNTDASSVAATTTTTTTYSDPDPSTSATTPVAQHDGPQWKAVAEAWRCRAKRRLSTGIPSLRPTMTSTLRRFSIRRPNHGEVQEFCVLKPSLRTFSLAELKNATRNFSKENVVGRGGFAKVYRGSLPGGELVAVKKLTAMQGRVRMEGFLSELGHIVNVSHPNIARLVGVGVDGGEHLVFPSSRLGCLSRMLHGSGGTTPMPWEARHRVAMGTARGLEYLHERCARRIVHRDIKPANILLMDNYEPLICDFGLARWLPAKLTHLQVTVFEGTFGYVPPEYTTHGVFSEKTDVFALGVVLLELLTGRRAIDAAKLSLVSWAKQFLDGEDEDEIPKMADPALGGRYDVEQLRNMARAAKLCIHSSPDLRPQMSQVVQILRGVGEPRRSDEGHKRTDQPSAMQETNGYDAARYMDDLSRHKALAFDFQKESTSLAFIEHVDS